MAKLVGYAVQGAMSDSTNALAKYVNILAKMDKLDNFPMYDLVLRWYNDMLWRAYEHGKIEVEQFYTEEGRQLKIKVSKEFMDSN